MNRSTQLQNENRKDTIQEPLLNDKKIRCTLKDNGMRVFGLKTNAAPDSFATMSDSSPWKECWFFASSFFANWFDRRNTFWLRQNLYYDINHALSCSLLMVTGKPKKKKCCWVASVSKKVIFQFMKTCWKNVAVCNNICLFFEGTEKISVFQLGGFSFDDESFGWSVSVFPPSTPSTDHYKSVAQLDLESVFFFKEKN